MVRGLFNPSGRERGATAPRRHRNRRAPGARERPGTGARHTGRGTAEAGERQPLRVSLFGTYGAGGRPGATVPVR